MDEIWFSSAAIRSACSIRTRHGRIELAVSRPVVDEVARILSDKFHWTDDDVADARRPIAEFTLLLSPAETLNVVTADPSDNRLLECAVAAGSSVLVSGDRHLLSLRSFRGIDIMTVTDFLAKASTGL